MNEVWKFDGKVYVVAGSSEFISEQAERLELTFTPRRLHSVRRYYPDWQSHFGESVLVPCFCWGS